MSDNSAIEWTDATWNPIRGLGPNRWQCRKLSPGCDHCYASKLNRRFGAEEYAKEGAVSLYADHGEAPIADFTNHAAFVRLDQKALAQPLHWKKPRRIFVCSVTDLFGEWVPDEWLNRIFAMMAVSQQHTFQLLTKRPSRMKAYLTSGWQGLWPMTEIVAAKPLGTYTIPGPPLPNVWLGVSIEADAYAWRAKILAEIPALSLIHI